MSGGNDIRKVIVQSERVQVISSMMQPRYEDEERGCKNLRPAVEEEARRIYPDSGRP
jgi:hypothetical protein